MMSQSAQKYVLAVDLGTSGPKVALVSADFEAVATAFEPVSLRVFDNGGAEQDPAEWWAAIHKAVLRLLDHGRVRKQDIIAVCCTAQWSGTVPVDERGRALTPAIIWMDSRGAEQIRKVNGGLLEVEGYAVDKIWRWMRLTGGAPGRSGKDPIAHIHYLMEHRPDIYEKTYKFLEPKDYLNLRLTGRFVSTYEAVTLHWVTDNRNINDIKYHPKLLRLTGLDREKLPDLIGSTDVVGTLKREVAEAWGLSTEVKVIGGTPDFHAVIIGAGAVKDYDPCLCIGTSTFLSCHYPRKKTDIFHNMAALPAGIPGKYVVMNEQEISGGALTFLKENILFPEEGGNTSPPDRDIYALFDTLAAGIPAGSGGLIFKPWLYGERTPVEDATIRGGFYNMSLKTTRDHMVRATMEGVAYNTRWLLKYVERFAGRPFEAIKMVGGGAQSGVWCQILADVLQREIRQVAQPRYANVKGAAALALVAAGLGSFEELAEKVAIERAFEPNVRHFAIYDSLFREFLNIYRKNRKIHARLNKMH